MNANGFEKLHGIDEMDEKQVLTLGSVGLAAYVYSYSSVGFCYRYSREGTKIVLVEKFSSVSVGDHN